MSWPMVRLGDVCEVFNGLWKGERPPFIRVGVVRSTNFTKNCEFTIDKTIFIDAEEKKYKDRKLRPGDIIVERSGGGPGQPVGRAVLFNEPNGDYTISNFTSFLRIKPEWLIDCRFLHLYLTSRYFCGATEEIQSHTIGLHNLDFSAYLDFKIPLPPLDEQKRIVEKLEKELKRVDEMKVKFERMEAAAEQYFKSALAEAFENVEGERVKLGDVCDVVSGKTPLRSCSEYWDGGSCAWFTIDDMREQGRDIFDTKQKITEAAMLTMRVIPKNTVLLCCTASVGACAIARIDITTNQQFNALVARCPDMFSPEYLYYFCLTIRPLLLDKSGKTTIDFVSKTKVESINVILPTVEEQDVVVRKLDSAKDKAEKIASIARRGIESCTKMRKALLAEAFDDRVV